MPFTKLMNDWVRRQRNPYPYKTKHTRLSKMYELGLLSLPDPSFKTEFPNFMAELHSIYLKTNRLSKRNSTVF